MFETDILNTCWIEDVYVILIALKNKKATEQEAKRRFMVKYTEFKHHNFDSMTHEAAWQYCKRNSGKIISHYENLAV